MPTLHLHSQFHPTDIVYTLRVPILQSPEQCRAHPLGTHLTRRLAVPGPHPPVLPGHPHLQQRKHGVNRGGRSDGGRNLWVSTDDPTEADHQMEETALCPFQRLSVLTPETGTLLKKEGQTAHRAQVQDNC